MTAAGLAFIGQVRPLSRIALWRHGAATGDRFGGGVGVGGQFLR